MDGVKKTGSSSVPGTMSSPTLKNTEPVLHPASSHDLQAELAQITKYFAGKEAEENWEDRQKCVQRMRNLLARNVHTLPGFVPVLRTLVDPFDKALFSLRTTLVNEAVRFWGDAGQKLGHDFEPLAEPVLSSLMKLCALTKRVNAQTAEDAIITQLIPARAIPSRTFMPVLCDACRDKSEHLRTGATNILPVLLATFDRTTVEKHWDHIEKILKSTLSDANPKVRQRARDAYWVLNDIHDQRIAAFFQTLEQSVKKTLQKGPGATSSQVTPAASGAATPLSGSIRRTVSSVSAASSRTVSRNSSIAGPSNPVTGSVGDMSRSGSFAAPSLSRQTSRNPSVATISGLSTPSGSVRSIAAAPTSSTIGGGAQRSLVKNTSGKHASDESQELVRASSIRTQKTASSTGVVSSASSVTNTLSATTTTTASAGSSKTTSPSRQSVASGVSSSSAARKSPSPQKSVVPSSAARHAAATLAANLLVGSAAAPGTVAQAAGPASGAQRRLPISEPSSSSADSLSQAAFKVRSPDSDARDKIDGLRVLKRLAVTVPTPDGDWNLAVQACASQVIDDARLGAPAGEAMILCLRAGLGSTSRYVLEPDSLSLGLSAALCCANASERISLVESVLRCVEGIRERAEGLVHAIQSGLLKQDAFERFVYLLSSLRELPRLIEVIAELHQDAHSDDPSSESFYFQAIQAIAEVREGKQAIKEGGPRKKWSEKARWTLEGFGFISPTELVGDSNRSGQRLSFHGGEDDKATRRLSQGPSADLVKGNTNQHNGHHQPTTQAETKPQHEEHSDQQDFEIEEDIQTGEEAGGFNGTHSSNGGETLAEDALKIAEQLAREGTGNSLLLSFGSASSQGQGGSLNGDSNSMDSHERMLELLTGPLDDHKLNALRFLSRQKIPSLWDERSFSALFDWLRVKLCDGTVSEERTLERERALEMIGVLVIFKKELLQTKEAALLSMLFSARKYWPALPPRSPIEKTVDAAVLNLEPEASVRWIVEELSHRYEHTISSATCPMPTPSSSTQNGANVGNLDPLVSSIETSSLITLLGNFSLRLDADSLDRRTIPRCVPFLMKAINFDSAEVRKAVVICIVKFIMRLNSPGNVNPEVVLAGAPAASVDPSRIFRHMNELTMPQKKLVKVYLDRHLAGLANPQP